jgi:hypothetical protein
MIELPLTIFVQCLFLGTRYIGLQCVRQKRGPRSIYQIQIFSVIFDAAKTRRTSFSKRLYGHASEKFDQQFV